MRTPTPNGPMSDEDFERLKVLIVRLQLAQLESVVARMNAAAERLDRTLARAACGAPVGRGGTGQTR